MIPEIKEMVTAIHTELESRDVSREEHTEMRAEMYRKPGEWRAKEQAELEHGANCPFAEDEPTLAERMNNAVLSSPGSGKRIEKFGRYSI